MIIIILLFCVCFQPTLRIQTVILTGRAAVNLTAHLEHFGVPITVPHSVRHQKQGAAVSQVSIEY